ncbi:hypothetical protein [Calothrix sp. CCY 0018]
MREIILPIDSTSIALLKALQQKQLEQIDSSSFEAETLPLPRVVRVEQD